MLILISGLLANKYMIEVADKAGEEQRDTFEEDRGEEEGSDYSSPLNLKMETTGQSV